MQTHSTWDGPLTDPIASLQRAKLIMLRQNAGVRVKNLWATKDAHDMLLKWLDDHEYGAPSGVKQSEPKGELKSIYGLAVTVFATRLDMLMQAWQHDLGEVIAIATTEDGNLYQMDFATVTSVDFIGRQRV